MSLDALPPLREVVAAHDLAAKKAFGQHFLFDLNLTAKIARAAPDLADHTVIEVGPGPGGLTRALLSAGAGHVIAVEKDARFAPILDEVAAAAPGRLSRVDADALKVDEEALLAAFGGGRPGLVASNLPYNVGTALAVKWLAARPWWSALVLMFQREVADRVVAPVGTPAYGRLAVLAHTRARPEFLFPVPARAFTPPPKVESAVIRLTPRRDAFEDVTALETVTAAAFGQRRKMLRRSLRGLGDADALLAAAGLAGDMRPETVPPEGFIALAQAWRDQHREA